MLNRTLEPEVMDDPRGAIDYDEMDHREVNERFVDDFLVNLANGGSRALSSGLKVLDASGLKVLDVGVGTAQIPIELCRRGFEIEVLGIDLADHMLKRSRENIERAGLQQRITVRKVDAKSMPFADGQFEVVLSNSILHHIPEPVTVIREMQRVLASKGLLFVRDLMRPETEAEVELLVRTYAGHENPHQQQLFRQSLHAALTVDEVLACCEEVKFADLTVKATSDRHWTLIAKNAP